MNFDALLSIWAERGQHGQLVNDQRNPRAPNHSAFQRSAFYSHIADDFSLRAFQSKHLYRSAHFGEHIQNCRACGIQTDVVDEHVGVGKQRSGGQKKYRRRQISRHVERFRGELAASVSSSQTVHTNGLAILLNVYAKFLQGELGVVAGARGLGDAGDAIGKQSGQQNR